MKIQKRYVGSVSKLNFVSMGGGNFQPEPKLEARSVPYFCPKSKEDL